MLVLPEALMAPSCRRRRAPYRYWTVEEESLVKEWVALGHSLAHIAGALKRPRRAVREKLRRMGLQAARAPRGPCDCEHCDQTACIRAVRRHLPLPRPECERAWPKPS